MSSRLHARWMWLALAVLAADQASKYAIEKIGGSALNRAVIPGLFNLVYTHNRGVAFGLLADTESAWVSWLLVLFSAAVMLLLVWLLAAEQIPGRGGQPGAALILGGAAGNVVDRLVRHSVVDFLYFHLRGFHWPAFNLADSAIVVGAGLVILSMFLERGHAAPGKV